MNPSLNPIKPYNEMLYKTLVEYDPEVQKLIEDETLRQFSSLELNASEKCVLQLLCQTRALETFRLDPKIWGVNVQLYSGSTANLSTFTALIQPQDRIMALSATDGGHSSSGSFTENRKISASSTYFQSFPYSVDPESKLIDYDYLQKMADIYKPKILICGASAYPRDWNFKRLREISDNQEAYLMMDASMAQVSGLVAGQVQNDPFEFCDVVTTTTHKTLRGPRGGLIFFRKDKDPGMESRIKGGVFPGFQGAVHYHSIAAASVALRQAGDPSFRQYAQAVIENSRALAARLVELGYSLQTGGSDNHLVLWDLRPTGLTGSRAGKIFDFCGIIVSKSAVSSDKSIQDQGGVRLGTSALTSRSMGPEQMVEVANFMHRAVQLSLNLQQETRSNQSNDFLRASYEGDEREERKQFAQILRDVQEFSRRFELPGFNVK
ncbi:pyridoxal phosphate-dependent transferase [Phakopsora pachyrhizi]|uniref:Serine hydroxymethyltransferase n=1 Tax=Phakopsora pachyrhizi TaxID=170000 RepID=A0AAV0AXZ1_PHAPC|nr:pyridoxal phosphate-dependent transferase [Phakopsora pachyrhizi]